MKTTKQSREKVKITWFGHSAFLLESPTCKTVLIDLWLDNPTDISKVDLLLTFSFS